MLFSSSHVCFAIAADDAMAFGSIVVVVVVVALWVIYKSQFISKFWQRKWVTKPDYRVIVRRKFKNSPMPRVMF